MEPAPAPQNRRLGCLSRLQATLASETIFKGQLLIYWIFCLLQLIADSVHHQPLLVFIVLSAGVSIVFGLMATASQSAYYLLPVIIMATFEALRFFFYTSLVGFHKHWDLLNPDWLPLPLREGEELLDICFYASLEVCFAFLAVTCLLLFDKYLMAELRRGDDQHRQLLQDGMRLNGYTVRQMDEVEEEEADSPPRYSEVSREPSELVLTAKEETSPPRYSQLSRLERK